MITSHPHRTVAVALFAAVLSACGGGGDDAPSAGNGSGHETVQSASGVTVVDESARAQATVLSAARVVFTVSGASGSSSCAGGGSVSFIATAGPSGSLTNGVPDAGETYTIQFASCRSQSDNSVVDGALTLTVNSANGDNLSVSTESHLVVVQQDRTLRLDGSSTLSHTVHTTGATQVTTERWQTPSATITSTHNNRTTRLSLTQVDLTQTVTTTNGVVTGRSTQGTLTMGYSGWLGDWSATIGTQGIVSFNANGTRIGGLWLITLPRHLVWLVPILVIEAD
jgi:hypothetical protein